MHGDCGFDVSLDVVHALVGKHVLARAALARAVGEL
jgi:hypothetical protein